MKGLRLSFFGYLRALCGNKKKKEKKKMFEGAMQDLKEIWDVGTFFTLKKEVDLLRQIVLDP